MSVEDGRPDPDVLLARVEREDAAGRRAKLKIFFGFAPGVGKTFAMLDDARRLRADGVEVLVGCVETHGRGETAALLEGLPVLPRRRSEYRGTTLEELDVDAALARRPDVLLVDELAHTNAPGGRHAKRWQDVLELLDAGIEVHTTLNVQHVESLNDVVAQISGVRVRETVPDVLLDRADAIALVDLPPEVLLERLRDGKVYVAEQAARAARGFFQVGNLLALRELALRRTADRVDVDVLAYRREHGVADTWPAAERVLVCVSPSPASARLVRAARRTAAGLRAPWVAVYVDSATRPPLAEDARARLDEHLRLAQRLGGEIAELEGTRIAETLVGYARQRNVTRILVGKPAHPRWRDRLTGSVLDELVRTSGDVDVHVIAGDDDVPAGGGASPPPAPREDDVAEAELRGAAEPYAWTLALVVGATALGHFARALMALPDIVMVYLLAIMFAAVRFGRGPSLLAAAASVAAYDFVFVPPYFTLAVSDSRHVLTFGMMFVVGLAIGTLTLRLRRQEIFARAREARTAALYALSRALGAEVDRGAIAAVAVEQTAALVGAGAAVLLPGPAGDALALAARRGAVDLGADELAVARWAFEHGRAAGRGTDTVPGARVSAIPLVAQGTSVGALVFAPRETVVDAGLFEFLESVGAQVALALARARLADEAKAAALVARTEELKSSLLSAVSHDLRTPLGTLKGSATLLRDGGALEPTARRAILDGMVEEAERLERLVSSLLDMSRVQSGTIVVRREWLPLDELVGGALAASERTLEGRTVTVEVDADAPLVSADPVLVERVLVNVLDNAAKYTPPGSPIEVRARVEGGVAEIEVRDHGPGFPPGDDERLFEKFQRGAPGAVPGAGLGLAIARGFAEAHGGTLTLRPSVEDGAALVLRLPSAGLPPTVETRA